jgi:hypothetical protein
MSSFCTTHKSCQYRLYRADHAYLTYLMLQRQLSHLLALVVLLITPLHRSSRKHHVQQYLYYCMRVHCWRNVLPSRCIETALHATVSLNKLIWLHPLIFQARISWCKHFKALRLTCTSLEKKCFHYKGKNIHSHLMIVSLLKIIWVYLCMKCPDKMINPDCEFF